MRGGKMAPKIAVIAALTLLLAVTAGAELPSSQDNLSAPGAVGTAFTYQDRQ